MAQYKFVECVHVDNAKGERFLVEKGTAVDVEFGKEPKTERPYVKKNDAGILNGCLTSCIRTGRAVASEVTAR